ncbi:hypothetical protein ILUMI_21733 [Ignelater luminosus]|uniref:Uncharacterized protein n=1 Tax=Ignelater luminosus TaxID=2038154 RepID=A0A8K0CBI2_IGNLU|nr:hypothetical protein ILUMI_21733 [Ignelater luminosus]
MKKALSNSKLSTPSKFVRRVLSRTSTASRSSHEETNKKANSEPQASTSSETMKVKQDAENLEVEVSSLREQVSVLQLALSNMKEDGDKKEKILTNLAKEKQQLTIDLKREKRSTTNLKQQLGDEREFYFKEKEQYCQEMNDCKKLKKKMSENKKKDISKEESEEIIACKSQISKLKDILNQTLEANYNLSVKFLRMKNTKVSLKNRLRKQMNDHEQAMKNIQATINNIKNEIADIVDKRFKLPISPSNKKYLQIIKQNGMLMHENLCLQMEVDRLTSKLNNIQYINQRNEMKKHLKCSRSNQPQKSEEKPNSSKQIVSKKSSEKESGTISTKPKSKSAKQLKEGQSKSKKSSTTAKSSTEKSLGEKNSASKSSPGNSNTNQEKKKPILKNSTKDMEVIKIFERKKVEGIPHIIMLSETTGQDTSRLRKDNEEKKDNDKIENDSTTKEFPCTLRDSQQELQLILPLISQKPSLSLIGTEMSDVTRTTSGVAIRTQSAPEIVQTSSFVSKHKH